MLFIRKVVQLVDKTWNDYGQRIDVIGDLVMDRYFDIFISLLWDWSKNVVLVVKNWQNYFFKI